MKLGWFIGLVVSLVLVGGCAKARPSPFSTKVEAVAKEMLQAVEARNMAGIDKVVEHGRKLNEKGHMTGDELGVLLGAQEYAKEEDWESAQKLIADSLAM